MVGKPHTHLLRFAAQAAAEHPLDNCSLPTQALVACVLTPEHVLKLLTFLARSQERG